MSQRNLLVLLLACAVSYACYVRGGQNPFARYVAEGLATIDQNALESVPDQELFNGAMDGMVGVLTRHGDQHSEFLDEQEADPLRTEIRQQFGGIGVRIGFEGEPLRLAIVAPPDADSPAARENLQAGDRILTIDGQATDGMEMGEVLRRMRGQPGTSVRLSIQQADATEPRTVELVREVINIESVLGDRRSNDGRWQFLLAADPRIAHVRITLFGERTPGELEHVLNNIVAQGAEAVVLDVRDNAGGALEAAVAICKMLLPAGKMIVETRGRDGEVRQRDETTEDGVFLSLPLAVIVNQESASAAEIVAACLQDHHRAVVAGQRSYGKGTVQQLVPLESGKSLLQLTWASFWRPSGAKIHRGAGATEDDIWGVVPNTGYERRLSPEEYDAFVKYRSDRDQIGPARAKTTASEENAPAAAAFVDEQLQLAVKYLQGELDGESR
ncbi:MAG: S41 family peptidase [Planctomycetes bacterium]|nr:S41 family peptidase [Planctomycetota bacterium]